MAMHDYEYRLYIDDLPSATLVPTNDGTKKVDYFEGIPIGLYVESSDKLYLFNHLNITIYAHDTIEGHERIVGFEVQPMSIAEENGNLYYEPGYSSYQVVKPGQKFKFTYRIRTLVSDINLTTSERCFDDLGDAFGSLREVWQ
jgi:hypothetical protein